MGKWVGKQKEQKAEGKTASKIKPACTIYYLSKVTLMCMGTCA